MNPNKIANLDNENTYVITNLDGEVTLEITGNFWGLRKYKLQSRPRKINGKVVHFVQNKVINPSYQKLYNNLKTNSYFLLGDIHGYQLFKIKCKFQNDSVNIFNDNFDYCFQLEKTIYTISDENLINFINKPNFSRQSCTNFTKLYGKTAIDLINYINIIRTEDFLR